jgi:excisionase family DNA binding protein
VESGTRQGPAKNRGNHRRSFGNREGSMITEGRSEPVEYLFTIQEAAERLRVSKWSVYNLIRANQLRTVKIGRRRLVTPAALAECIKLLGEEAA